MIRTQIQLTEEQSEQLRNRFVRLGKSVALQIREAVDMYLLYFDQRPQKKIIDIAGKFHPVPLGELKAHDQYFVDAIQDSKRRRT